MSQLNFCHKSTAALNAINWGKCCRKSKGIKGWKKLDKKMTINFTIFTVFELYTLIKSKFENFFFISTDPLKANFHSNNHKIFLCHNRCRNEWGPWMPASSCCWLFASQLPELSPITHSSRVMPQPQRCLCRRNLICRSHLRRPSPGNLLRLVSSVMDILWMENGSFFWKVFEVTVWKYWINVRQRRINGYAARKLLC